MHNASSVPVPVWCSAPVSSLPRRSSCRLVHSTPHTALSSPVFSSLSLRSPRDPKSTERGESWKRGRKSGGGSRTPGPSPLRTPQQSPTPAFPPLQSPERAGSGGGGGDGLRIFAQGRRQELRRPRRVSQSVYLSPSVCSLIHPPLRFLLLGVRSILCSSSERLRRQQRAMQCV
jgi:hypothetical protein